MKNIVEMKQKRAALIAEARAILDFAEKENRSLLGEEIEKYNKIDADVDNIAKEIEIEERQQSREKELEKRSSEGFKAQTNNNLDNNVESRDAFLKMLRHGVSALSETEKRALTLTPDTAGGYTAPVEFEKQLVQALNVTNVIRSLATVVQTSNDRNIPIVSAHGSASWMNEEGSFTASDETFSQATISAFKLGTLVKVSEELLNDSAFNLESYLVSEFARRFGVAEESAFANGTGSGQPTGIIGSAGVGTTAASASAITSDELIALYHALGRQYRNMASWLMADGTAKVIRKLKNGTTGDYMWQPGLQSGQPDTLLNRPVYISDGVPTIAASSKPIIFADFKYYYVADRGNRFFQRLVELYAANGYVGFRGYERVDGKLILTEAAKTLQMHS